MTYGRQESDEREARWRGFMTAAQGGDSASYEKLLRELLPRVRAYVMRRLADRDAAEDVVQNVFVSIHRARHTYRPERPFGPWLWAVARNAVIDQLRVRARSLGREISLEADGVPEPSVEPVEPRRALAPELRTALESLPDNQREAVELVQLQGLSIAEAAARAGVSGTVLKVRAHRGYRALRARLGREST